MNARVVCATLVAASLAVVQPVVGQDAEDPVTFSGSVALVSDYTFRGISQTYEDFAIQGGVTGTVVDPGVYFGFWGSSLDFGEATAADRAVTEVDLLGGWKGSLGGAADADIGVIYYAYPGTGDTYEYNFVELALGLSRAFSDVTAGLKGYWSPDYFAASGSSFYLNGSLGATAGSVSFAGALGYQWIEENSTFGTPDYLDYSVGATLSTLGIGLGAALVGTDVDEADCFAGGSDLCKPRVVLSVSRAL
jgi:uncharacterized protein (TIGR02001 family)